MLKPRPASLAEGPDVTNHCGARRRLTLSGQFNMTSLLYGILLICLFLFLYHHVIYPTLLAALAALMRRFSPSPAPEQPLAGFPSLTVLVPAHNEAPVIARKIENLLATSYPRDRLKIVIVLDGCTDGTRQAVWRVLQDALAAPARAPSTRCLTVVEYPTNIGKVAVLNRQIEPISSEIVALSDASSLLAPDALARAVRYFADPAVGVVAPTYRLANPGSDGEKTYTSHLTRVRNDEATLDSPLGCHGACYLFRRAKWMRLPDDTINDDFMLPLRIIAGGSRGIYDSSIISEEMEKTSRPQEFRRRTRLGAGNMQQSLELLVWE